MAETELEHAFPPLPTAGGTGARRPSAASRLQSEPPADKPRAASARARPSGGIWLCSVLDPPIVGRSTPLHEPLGCTCSTSPIPICLPAAAVPTLPAAGAPIQSPIPKAAPARANQRRPCGIGLAQRHLHDVRGERRAGREAHRPRMTYRWLAATYGQGSRLNYLGSPSAPIADAFLDDFPFEIRSTVGSGG